MWVLVNCRLLWRKCIKRVCVFIFFVIDCLLMVMVILVGIGYFEFLINWKYIWWFRVDMLLGRLMGWVF